MIHKEVLNFRRIRKINGSFAFIEHRFRHWIKHLSSEELLLYLFLVLAADEQGLSYYSPESILSHLKLTPDQYRRCLERLDQSGTWWPLRSPSFRSSLYLKGGSRLMIDRALGL